VKVLDKQGIKHGGEDDGHNFQVLNMELESLKEFEQRFEGNGIIYILCFC